MALATEGADFTVIGEGAATVYLLIPRTQRAQDWIDEHIGDDAMMLGRGVAVEHRYITNVLQGILNDGLEVV